MLDGKPLVDAHIHLASMPTLKMSWDRWAMARRADGDPTDLYDDEGAPIAARFLAYLEDEGVDCAILLAEYSPRVTGIQPIEDLVSVAAHDPVRIRVRRDRRRGEVDRYTRTVPHGEQTLNLGVSWDVRVQRHVIGVLKVSQAPGSPV